MDLINVDERADIIIAELEKYFGDKIKDIKVVSKVPVPQFYEIVLTFIAYDYHIVNFSTTGYGTSCYVSPIGALSEIKTRDKSDFYKLDFDDFFKKTDQELKLRILDKYLKAKGYV